MDKMTHYTVKERIAQWKIDAKKLSRISKEREGHENVKERTEGTVSDTLNDSSRIIK